MYTGTVEPKLALRFLFLTRHKSQLFKNIGCRFGYS